MELLTTSDCEGLLALTSDLYSVGDIASLPQHILRALRPLISHKFGGCHLIEP